MEHMAHIGPYLPRLPVGQYEVTGYESDDTAHDGIDYTLLCHLDEAYMHEVEKDKNIWRHKDHRDHIPVPLKAICDKHEGEHECKEYIGTLDKDKNGHTYYTTNHSTQYTLPVSLAGQAKGRF
jgi:hypothetical protein